MRGSGSNASRLLPGVGVHVDDRKEWTTGREKCSTRGEREVCQEGTECCGKGGRQAEEDVVGKEGLQEFLELLGGALFYGEDACRPYTTGHPMWGVSSCNDAVAGKL